jgi:hypothetical protein
VFGELERIWGETVVAYFRVSGMFLKALRKTTKTSVRIARVPAEIRTGQFRKQYRANWLVDCK